jgi:arylsulfatase
MDALGGPRLFNHYPWGWAQAGNTPFRWYKQFTHAGGITNGLIVRWPDGGVPAGEVRRQYLHVIDVAPTLLDAIGIEPPAQVRGVTQQPMHGVSMTYTFAAPEAASRRRSQYYEMWGNRGIWSAGWMAVCRLQPDGAGAHPPAPMTTPFDELPWELYHHESDPSERTDLASLEPARLRAMVEMWWAAAGQYQVLPIDDRPRGMRWPQQVPLPRGADPARTVFHGGSGPHERGAAPRIAGASFRIVADLTCTDEAAGVLYMQGGLHGGYCWFLQSGKPRLEVATSSIHTVTIGADQVVPAGRHCLEVLVSANQDMSGRVQFLLDGGVIGGGEVDRLVKRVPIPCGRAYVGYSVVPMVSQSFEPPYPLQGDLHRLTVLTGTADADPEELAIDLREQ